MNLHNLFSNNIEMLDIDTREYRLMYFFGVWVTANIVYAESDAEAIFDTRSAVKEAEDKLPYALWCGNRLVKKFNYTGEAYNPTFTTIK